MVFDFHKNTKFPRRPSYDCYQDYLYRYKHSMITIIHPRFCHRTYHRTNTTKTGIYIRYKIKKVAIWLLF
ncbi:hypothetical protein CK934_06035 [Chitinophaga sp. MD30]|nr:hypothetical protein CK934_06035 [Chitinophaga sp. MD30]